MNKTPKSKKKSKLKMKSINNGLPKHHSKSSTKNKGFHSAVQGSPKTMNYSKVMKKYGNIIDDNDNLSQLEREAIVNKRKVSYDIDANNTSFTSLASTRSRLNSAITPSNTNTTSNITKLNREDYVSAQKHNSNIERLNNNKKHKTQTSFSIDSNENSSLTNTTTIPTSNTKGKRKEALNSNNKPEEHLINKIAIVLKLFYKYSYKLFQLINMCSDCNQLYKRFDILNELKMTIHHLHRTVTNDKLYSMFEMNSISNTIEEEKNSFNIKALSNIIPCFESKSNEALIEKYENQIKKLKEQNAKLKQNMTSYEQKESETIKHFKENSENVTNENIVLKTNNNKLKEKNKILQDQIKLLLEKEVEYKNQSNIISKLQNEIESLQTDIKFKVTTIDYLEKNLHKLKANPSLSDNNESKCSMKTNKYSQTDINQYGNTIKNIYDLPKQVSNAKSNVMNQQNSPVMSYRDIKHLEDESIIMYGSRISNTHRISNESNINNHNAKANKIIIDSNDLEPYLTKNLNKQIDKDLIEILSEDSQHILNHNHNNNNNNFINKKQPDSLKKEIEVLDKEIITLKYKLKSIINKKGK